MSHRVEEAAIEGRLKLRALPTRICLGSCLLPLAVTILYSRGQLACVLHATASGAALSIAETLA